jgi:hypothetical protein
MSEEECQSVNHESSQPHSMEREFYCAESDVGNSGSGEADSPVMGYHPQSLEPVTRVRNNGIKIPNHGRSKFGTSRFTNIKTTW